MVVPDRLCSLGAGWDLVEELDDDVKAFGRGLEARS